MPRRREEKPSGGGVGGGNKSKCYYFCTGTRAHDNHNLISPGSYLDGKYHQSTRGATADDKQRIYLPDIIQIPLPTCISSSSTESSSYQQEQQITFERHIVAEPVGYFAPVPVTPSSSPETTEDLSHVYRKFLL